MVSNIEFTLSFPKRWALSGASRVFHADPLWARWKELKRLYAIEWLKVSEFGGLRKSDWICMRCGGFLRCILLTAVAGLLAREGPPAEGLLETWLPHAEALQVPRATRGY